MTDHPGFGVVLGMLGGNAESAQTFRDAIGKKIASLEIDDNELKIRFEDGTGIFLVDSGQSCCEARYMNCDDDLSAFIGATLMGGEVKDGPDEEDQYGQAKECQFLVITTNRGPFTVANYNEHNGYYGGFWITVNKLKAGK